MIRNNKPSISKKVFNKHGHFNRNYIDCNINYTIKFYEENHHKKNIKEIRNNRQQSIQKQLKNKDYKSDFYEFDKFYDCEEFEDEDAKDAKDAKDVKDVKDAKDVKEDAKDVKEDVKDVDEHDSIEIHESLKKDQSIKCGNLIYQDWERL